jgi:hypothetical protein
MRYVCCATCTKTIKRDCIDRLQIKVRPAFVNPIKTAHSINTDLDPSLELVRVSSYGLVNFIPLPSSAGGFIVPYRGGETTVPITTCYTGDPSFIDVPVSAWGNDGKRVRGTLLPRNAAEIMKLIREEHRYIANKMILDTIDDPDAILIPRRSCDELGIEDGATLRLSVDPTVKPTRERLLSNAELIIKELLRLQMQPQEGAAGISQLR